MTSEVTSNFAHLNQNQPHAMRRRSTMLWSMVLYLVIAGSCHAVIQGQNSLEIDFTKPEDAQKKCILSPADKLTITHEGLGWDGAPNGMREGSIQTQPIGVGLSWRTVAGMTIRVDIQPSVTATTLPNGQNFMPDRGALYVRYSPDQKHWSTWQALQHDNSNPDVFSGTIRVPNSEREEYGKCVSEYSTLDVPWKNDEEAAVRWALARDPNLFARHIPFIGHVEFLFETSFRGGQRITSFRATMGWGVGGLHSPPKDKNAHRDRDAIPWRFVGEDIANTPGSKPAAAEYDAPAAARRQFRRDMISLENSLQDGDVFEAERLLDGLARRVPPNSPSLSARLSKLETDLLDVMKKRETKSGDGYTWIRNPGIKPTSWPKSKAEDILKQQLRSKATTGVAVLRVWLENPEDEQHATLIAHELNTWSCCWGYGNNEQFTDGGYVVLGKAYKSGSQHGTIEINSLRHAPASIEIDVPENKVVYAGELLVRALPKDQLGSLMVRVTPEPGLSLEGARVCIGRWYARAVGGTLLKSDGTCLIENIGAGSCEVYVHRPDVLCSPRVKAKIVAGSTSHVDLRVYARRRVAMDWKYRVPAGKGEWTTGTTTLLTGQEFPLNMWGANANIFKIGEWYGPTANIQHFNGRLLPARAEDFDLSLVRMSPEEFQRDGQEGHPIEIGKVFAVRYGPDAHAKSEGEALVRIRSIEPVVALTTKPAQ